MTLTVRGTLNADGLSYEDDPRLQGEPGRQERTLVFSIPLETEAGVSLGTESMTLPISAPEAMWAAGFDFPLHLVVRGRRVKTTTMIAAGLPPGEWGVTTDPVTVPPDQVEETVEIQRGDDGEIVGLTKATYSPVKR